MTLASGARLALLFLFLATPAFAQDPLGWNSPRALELIERARVRRELPRGDSTLRSYQAKANGYVYFYLDRREDDERTLVKVDQIALDLFWKRPNLTKQCIVGLRDVSRLPNRMYYHLDHLTVVQNNLGDVIRIGDGDEVRDVPHPAAPGADTIYDFRVADSVTLQLGGGQPEVRVYQINVRPKRHDRSAMIGSIYVDRAAADIVRMTFTFTPASYVDRRLDYINISLDNGLFGGKYWLPNEQSVEIRRQLPELDFAAGAVIKGRITVSGYGFNEPIPDSVFYGRAVSAVPEAQRESFPFPADIYAGIAEEGLAPPPQMADLRAQAAELLGQTRLSGLPAWRLYAPNASSVLRHNETEGWFGGAGITYTPSTTFRVDVTGGYAFGAEKPEVSAAVRLGERNHVELMGYYNQPRDVGIVSGMPGVINTFSSAFGGTDYTNLYFVRGARIGVGRAVTTRWNAGFGLSAEHHDSSSVSLAGNYYGAHLLADRSRDPHALFDWGASGELSLYRGQTEGLGSETGGRLVVRSDALLMSADKKRDLYGRIILAAGLSVGEITQFAVRYGGRETLPGWDYRSLVSENLVALGRLEYSHTIFSPWVRLRAVGYSATAYRPATGDGPDEGFPTRISGGLGAGLLWDVLRVDVVKGAEWQTIVSVRRDFWDML